MEIIALGLIAAMRLFPETAFAKMLHRWLVERPTRRLATLQRHQLIFLLIAIAMALAAGEVIAVVGSADLALGLAWDLSIYFDAVAVTAVVAVARYAGITVKACRARFFTSKRVVVAARERRSRPRSRPSPNANDDDPSRAVAA